MTAQPSNEDRDRLRLQAWTQRNQESFQTKGQNLESTPLFEEPYKRNKRDELSIRIQRMLGNFDDNTTAGPFIVPCSSNFPLTNNLHPRSDLPYKSPKGPCANPSLRRGFNSPKYQNEDESQASSQDSQLIHSTPAHRKKNPHSPQRHSLDAKDSQFTSADEPQRPGSTENTSSSSPGNNMQFLAKDLCPQLNRTFSMSHSQAFNLPLSCKQTNAAMMQKPTAYVRPMDGPEVVTESPELKPTPERCTRLTGVILNKPIQEKASTLPQFLETLTSEIQCVEHVLSEMTCSWPPLLSGIHSPCAPNINRSVKVTEENAPKQDNGHLSTEPPLSLRSSQVDSDSDNGTDPPLSNSPKRESAPLLMPSGDWQLDQWVNFSQQNYRRKSQWAAPRSPKLSLLKGGLKPSSARVFSPDRDTSNRPSLNQKTVPTAQLSSTQENHEHQSSHKSRSTSSPLGSSLPMDPVKHILQNQNGGVSVNSDLTLSREQEPGLKERPKVKSHPKQSKNGSVVFESEVTTNHNKNKYKKSDHCTACTNSIDSYSDHLTPACRCGKSKGEAKHKRFANLSQKDKHLHGRSQDNSKGTPSLVVKIDLNLLSKKSRTLKSPGIKLCTKDYKVTNSRKNDKGDQYCPKKKLKPQGHNPSLHTARLENSNPTEATEKRSIKKDEMPLTSSVMRDCSQKSKRHKQFNGNAPQLNKTKNAGKIMEEPTVTKLFSDSHRPLLRFEDRHYPVKHYIKEAKRLKHKADTEVDKLTKIFHYLDGALFFIESGIAMEKDPQISMSSYTMFAETVELIKFVLNLTNSEELSPTESDILAICLKCQALLQMAMFHTKEKAAISYSKTLTDHFNSSSPSPPPSFGKRKTFPMSPTNPLSCSGPALCGSAAGVKGAPNGAVGVPQNIGQMALTYVNITTLFLSAHDLWEQAEKFTNKGSGLLTELNKVMGALSLTSTMSSTVCYIRQALHWLQMDCMKVK